MCLFFLKNIIKDFYVFYNIFISFRCPQQRINKGFDYMIRVLFGAYKGTFYLIGILMFNILDIIKEKMLFFHKIKGSYYLQVP